MRTLTKHLLLIVLILLMSNIQAQEKFTSFYNDFSKKTYDIDILYDDNSNYVLFINMFSLDKTNPNGGLFINNFEHQSFLDTLKKVEDKYDEWTNVGKDNDINDFVKKVKINYQTCGYFLIKNNIEIDNIIYLTFIFKIVNGKKYLLTMATNDMSSIDDPSITHDGFVIVFSSSAEIDYLINILSIEKVKTYLKTPKTGDLFKD